jgi:hypothetical protein
VLTAGELPLGMATFFAILWLALIATFATGTLNARRERSNGSGQPL